MYLITQWGATCTLLQQVSKGLLRSRAPTTCRSLGEHRPVQKVGEFCLIVFILTGSRYFGLADHFLALRPRPEEALKVLNQLFDRFLQHPCFGEPYDGGDDFEFPQYHHRLGRQRDRQLPWQRQQGPMIQSPTMAAACLGHLDCLQVKNKII